MALESRKQCDISESDCESRLSRMSADHDREKHKLQSSILDLQKQVLALDRKLKKEREEKLRNM